MPSRLLRHDCPPGKPESFSFPRCCPCSLFLGGVPFNSNPPPKGVPANGVPLFFPWPEVGGLDRTPLFPWELGWGHPGFSARGAAGERVLEPAHGSGLPQGGGGGVIFRVCAGPQMGVVVTERTAKWVAVVRFFSKKKHRKPAKSNPWWFFFHYSGSLGKALDKTAALSEARAERTTPKPSEPPIQPLQPGTQSNCMDLPRNLNELETLFF